MKESVAFAVYGYSRVPQNWTKRFGLGVNHLYYIHSGSGGYELHGTKKPFVPGYIYLIPQCSEAKPYSDENDPIIHTYCDFELIPSVISSQVLFFDPKATEMDKAAVDIFNLGGKIATQQRERGFPFLLPQKTERLFSASVSYLVSRVIEGKPDAMVKDEIILNSIEYMHKHLDEKLSIAELAVRSYMSEGGFIRRFKSTIGYTPYAYLKKIRLNMANFLKEAGYTLDDIAARTGYSDAVALLHAIKKENIDEKEDDFAGL